MTRSGTTQNNLRNWLAVACNKAITPAVDASSRMKSVFMPHYQRNPEKTSRLARNRTCLQRHCIGPIICPTSQCTNQVTGITSWNLDFPKTLLGTWSDPNGRCISRKLPWQDTFCSHWDFNKQVENDVKDFLSLLITAMVNPTHQSYSASHARNPLLDLVQGMLDRLTFLQNSGRLQS